MDLPRYLTEHPESVGETYGEHLRHATGFGVRMVWAGIACMIHAVLPFLFVKTGSRAICELHERMVTNRRRSNIVGVEPSAQAFSLRGQHVR